MKYLIKTYNPKEAIHGVGLRYDDAFDLAWDICLKLEVVVRMVDEDGEVFAYFEPSDVAGAVDVDYKEEE